MASKPSISRQAILDAAYRQAQREGIASLSIRGIAADCGVAIGSIYNHFPDKASLVTEVIGRFWEQAARGEEGRSCFRYRPGQNLVAFCKQVAAGLEEALAEFRSDWLAEIASLDTRTLQRGACCRAGMLPPHRARIPDRHRQRSLNRPARDRDDRDGSARALHLVEHAPIPQGGRLRMRHADDDPPPRALPLAERVNRSLTPAAKGNRALALAERRNHPPPFAGNQGDSR